MKELPKKILKTGFGLGLLTLEQAKKAVTIVKKELELSEEESKRLALQLVKKSRDTAEDVLRTISRHFEEAVVKSGLAKKNELKAAKKVITKRVKKFIQKRR